MGKSPGKWIKTMLFGKKATRSNSTEGRNALKAGKGKGYTAAIGPTTSMENSPVISGPVLSMFDNGFNKELKGNSSSSGADASVISCASPGAKNQGVVGHAGLSDGEKFRKEQAAIKAQAVFRGFLARRAFRALKGIIRLQALVRGHLVSRQAVVTLHSTLGIIKLQALARSKKVPKCLDLNSKRFSNTFVCKLLCSSLVVIPLQIQYDQGEPNSLFNWMNRWTLSQFWKPMSQQKTSLDSNFHPKRGSYAMETESCRSKRNVHRNSANVDPEPEKPKRNMRRVIASVDSLHDDPQSELEKVKRNLRKVTSSYLETNRMVIQTDTKEQSIDDSSESMKKDTVLTPDPIPEIEVASKSIIVEEPVDLVDPMVDNTPADSNPLPSIDNKEENISAMDGPLNVKKEQTCNEPQKTGKRRASFSAKSEYAENGVQNARTLPSYMQATESAKAKLRGQTSPILASESAEKNGATRRHSLPSSTNGKVTSHSPRTRRILQASVKGGIRSDGSLLSSRDANEKLIQVEWKR